MSGFVILYGTIVAVVLMFVAILLVIPLAPSYDKALIRVMIITAAICMWMMWVITYMSQMNPLVNPQRSSSSS